MFDRTNYGVEYSMTCDLDRDIHKVEKTNCLFNIRQISFAPWRMDQHQEKEFHADLENQMCEYLPPPHPIPHIKYYTPLISNTTHPAYQILRDGF